MIRSEAFKNRLKFLKERNRPTPAPARAEAVQGAYEQLTENAKTKKALPGSEILDLLKGIATNRGSDQRQTGNEPQQRPTKKGDAFADRSEILEILDNARTPAPRLKRRIEAGVSQWSASTRSSMEDLPAPARRAAQPATRPPETSAIKTNKINTHRKHALDRLEGRIGAKIVSLPGEADPSAKAGRRITPYPGTKIRNPDELERRVPRQVNSRWSESIASSSSATFETPTLGTATKVVIAYGKPRLLDHSGERATSATSQNLPDQVVKRGYDLERPRNRGR